MHLEPNVPGERGRGGFQGDGRVHRLNGVLLLEQGENGVSHELDDATPGLADDVLGDAIQAIQEGGWDEAMVPSYTCVPGSAGVTPAGPVKETAVKAVGRVAWSQGRARPCLLPTGSGGMVEPGGHTEKR